jgi:transcriptional regulator with XRE-family HTH domain
MEIFGVNVKKELKRQNKKQVELAAHLNVQKSTLSEWLNNNNEPPMKIIVDIATYLNVSTDYLLGLED